MNAFDAAQKNGLDTELLGKLQTLFTNQNTARASDRTLIPATFLKVTVVVQ
jgi:hypothetical protein